MSESTQEPWAATACNGCTLRTRPSNRSDITGDPLEMDFEIYRIIGGGEDGEAWYAPKDHKKIFTVSMDDADECSASGCIKWDGCINVDIQGHFCGRDELRDLHLAIQAAYDKALEMMPGKEEGLAWLKENP